jgi:hypothetical protein
MEKKGRALMWVQPMRALDLTVGRLCSSGGRTPGAGQPLGSEVKESTVAASRCKR